MKYFRVVLILSLAAMAALSGCTSINNPESSSWTVKNREKARGTIRIVSVSAEKPGDWGSLEREVRDLVPLLFFERGFVAVSPDGEYDYTATVTVREREYPKGWKTRSYLSAEVRIWAGDDYVSQPLPMSAGRALHNGKDSFISSSALSVMLRDAVKNAISGLPRRVRR